MPTILTKGQRRLFRVLLWLAIFVLANSTYLFFADPGTGLTVFYQLMLIGHLVGGLALLLVMTVFFLWHLGRVKKLMHASSAVSGILLTLSTYLLFATGLFIIYESNAQEHLWIFYSHRVLAVVAVLGYATHRSVSHFKPTRSAFVRGTVGFASALGVFVAFHVASAPEKPAPVAQAPAPEDPFIPFVARNYGPEGTTFAPSKVTTASGYNVNKELITRNEVPDAQLMKEDFAKFNFLEREPVGAQTCKRCHPDVVEQWEDSMHRFSSFNNPWYRASVEKGRETDGFRKSFFCAGCHDPAVMLPGSFDKPIDPYAPESQTGLACLYCHQIDARHGLEGNGNFNVADKSPSPYLFDDQSTGFGRFVADQMTKAKPTAHKRKFLKPLHKTSEFCMVCHKVSLDVAINDYKWLRGQDEYDKWHDSGVAHNAARTFYLPPAPRNCQDCHMPLEPAPKGDVAATDGKVKSHRFYGPNTAMSHLRGDFEHLDRIRKFRQGNLVVDVFAVEHGGRLDRGLDPAKPVLQAGAEAVFEVVVRNKGVGHTFPGGTNDSNEGWLDFRVTDQDGNEIFRSGAVGDDRYVDPKAHFYRTVMIKHDGTWAQHRQAQRFHAPAFNRVIGPGTADVARYGVIIPEGTTAIRVEAKLQWRKFNRAFHEFVFNQPGIRAPDLPHLEGKKVPDLPIDTLADDAVDLAVSGEAKHDSADAEQWMRFNDHGIASFLQGAYEVAEGSWRAVAERQPQSLHGWRNLARRWIVSGYPERAREYLEKVDEVAPTDPQRPYFWGRYHERMEEFEEAERAYLASLDVFPGDRDTWRRLGNVRYKLGRWNESLEAYLRVLEIDPEDLEAHKRRLDIYRQLGDEYKAGEAEKAFEKYRLDDEREQTIRRFLLDNPEVNEDAQMRHVHR